MHFGLKLDIQDRLCALLFGSDQMIFCVQTSSTYQHESLWCSFYWKYKKQEPSSLKQKTLLSPGTEHLFQRDSSLCCSSQPLWCTSMTLDLLLLLCATVQETRNTFMRQILWVSTMTHICRNLILNDFQTTSTCGLDPIWKNCIYFFFSFFLLSSVLETNLDIISIFHLGLIWMLRDQDKGLLAKLIGFCYLPL